MNSAARIARARAAMEIGSLGTFIVECLECHLGQSLTLGAIYMRYLQWRPPEEEQLGPKAFAAQFRRLVVRLIPESEIHREKLVIVVRNVGLTLVVPPEMGI